MSTRHDHEEEGKTVACPRLHGESSSAGGRETLGESSAGVDAGHVAYCAESEPFRQETLNRGTGAQYVI